MTGGGRKKKKEKNLLNDQHENDHDNANEKLYASGQHNNKLSCNDYDNDEDDDDDYYYNRKLTAEPTVLTNRNANHVYKSVTILSPSAGGNHPNSSSNNNCIGSTSSGASGSSSSSSGVVVSTGSVVGNSLIITTSKLATSAHLPLEAADPLDPNSSSTSGITSGASSTGSSRNSTDGADDIKVVNDSILTINTIKYNAKTNTMLKPATTKKLVSQHGEFQKSPAHLKTDRKKQLRFQYDTISKDRKDSGCIYAENESNESDITRSPSNRNNNGPKTAHNSLLSAHRNGPLVSVKGEMASSRAHDDELTEENGKEEGGPHGNYYQWVNDGSASPSTSSPSSVTPIESCAYSTSSLTPPITHHSNQVNRHVQRQQQVVSSSHDSNSSHHDSEGYNDTLPFPTSHFNLTREQNQLQQQLMKLNSGSSLTVVSKVPSTSFTYLSTSENPGANAQTVGEQLLTRSTVEHHPLNKELVDPLANKKHRSKSSTNSSTSSGCS